jgi:hypothetical protein
VKTWNNKKIAIIECKGYVLGWVSLVIAKQDDRIATLIAFKDMQGSTLQDNKGRNVY